MSNVNLLIVSAHRCFVSGSFGAISKCHFDVSRFFVFKIGFFLSIENNELFIDAGSVGCFRLYRASGGVLSEKLGGSGAAGRGGRYESLRVMAAISRSALCQLVVVAVA